MRLLCANFDSAARQWQMRVDEFLRCRRRTYADPYARACALRLLRPMRKYVLMPQTYKAVRCQCATLARPRAGRRAVMPPAPQAHHVFRCQFQISRKVRKSSHQSRPEGPSARPNTAQTSCARPWCPRSAFADTHLPRRLLSHVEHHESASV